MNNENKRKESDNTANQNNLLFDRLASTLRQDPIQGLVSSKQDSVENVISITSDTIMYMAGLRDGIRVVNCSNSLRTILANLHKFTNLSSIYLKDIDMPLYVEQWPKSLEVVSILGECDVEPLNGLHNLRKLGLFQTNLNLTKLNIVAPNLEELAFISAEDENIISWFTNLKFLAYGTHRGDLQPISPLKRLKHLFIEDYRHTTLEGIQGCEELTNLRIQSKCLQDISALRGNETLVEVSFIPTREAIRSIEPLTCSKIKVLNIPNSAVRDFTPLQTMQSLEILNLNGGLIEDLSVLEGLTKLHTLDLSEVEAIALPDFLKPLLKMPSLRKICINYTHQQYIPSDLREKVRITFPRPSTVRKEGMLNNEFVYENEALTQLEIDKSRAMSD